MKIMRIYPLPPSSSLPSPKYKFRSFTAGKIASKILISGRAESDMARAQTAIACPSGRRISNAEKEHPITSLSEYDLYDTEMRVAIDRAHPVAISPILKSNTKSIEMQVRENKKLEIITLL